jgi:hypothetical protein
MAETHVLQLHVATDGLLELLRMALLTQPGLGLEHFRDPRARGERLLQRRHPLPEHAKRPDEHDDVGVEGHEEAEAETAGDHLPAAHPEDRGDPDQR